MSDDGAPRGVGERQGQRGTGRELRVVVRLQFLLCRWVAGHDVVVCALTVLCSFVWTLTEILTACRNCGTEDPCARQRIEHGCVGWLSGRSYCADEWV